MYTHLSTNHEHKTTYHKYNDNSSVLRIFFNNTVFLTISLDTNQEYESTSFFEELEYEIRDISTDIFLGNMEEDELFQLSTVWDYPVPIDLVKTVHKNINNIIQHHKNSRTPLDYVVISFEY